MNHAWQSIGRKGQRRYSALAIQTCLMLRTAFRMALRQAEGLLGSVMTLMKLKLSAPDHTTVSRRAVTLPALPHEVPAGPLDFLIDSTGLQVFGAGQWLEEKHGAKSRRSWRKRHLAVDADSGMIVSHTLTGQHADDPSQVAPLLEQVDGEIARVIADGAYDGAPTYQIRAARRRHRCRDSTALDGRGQLRTGSAHPARSSSGDDRRAGTTGLAASHGLGRRALVETTMGRYKAIIGARLGARGFAAQQSEAAIAVAVLNRMMSAARPKSVRRERAAA